MERDELLAKLGKIKPYYLEIEETIQLWNHEVEIFPHEEANGKCSFRHYINGKFVSYYYVGEGYFDVMTRFGPLQVAEIGDKIEDKSDYAKTVWAARYPCGNGAWIHYFVSDKKSMKEALWFLESKVASLNKKSTSRR